MLMKMHHRKINGFSLMELMVAVAIVGILAAIALPSYKNSVRKSKRQVAISDMLLYAQAQEKYRTNNLTYAPLSSLTGVYAVNKASSSSDYTFTIDSGTTGVNPTSSAYRIVATPIGSQNNGYEATYCNPLTLNQANTRTPVTCWAR